MTSWNMIKRKLKRWKLKNINRGLSKLKPCLDTNKMSISFYYRKYTTYSASFRIAAKLLQSFFEVFCNVIKHIVNFQFHDITRKKAFRVVLLIANLYTIGIITLNQD